MFRAFGHSNSSVLDGGLPRWEAEGYPIENEQNAPPEEIPEAERKGIYPEPELDSAVVKSTDNSPKSHNHCNLIAIDSIGYEQIVSNAARDPAADPKAAIVLDARPNGR